MKRLKHPLHGFHHVYSNAEEEVMRKAGWVEDDGKELEDKLKALEINRPKLTLKKAANGAR